MSEPDENSYDALQSGGFAVEAIVTAGDWPAASCETACRAALAALTDRMTRQDGDAPVGFTLDIELSDDDRVAEVNAHYRDKDGATNVLSFPALNAAEVAMLPQSAAHAPDDPARAPRMLGTIILADGVVTRESGAQGKGVADHLSHLVVHGVLHVLGYDHDSADRAEVMETAERRILAGLGIRDPYFATVLDA